MFTYGYGFGRCRFVLLLYTEYSFFYIYIAVYDIFMKVEQNEFWLLHIYFWDDEDNEHEHVFM